MVYRGGGQKSGAFEMGPVRVVIFSRGRFRDKKLRGIDNARIEFPNVIWAFRFAGF